MLHFCRYDNVSLLNFGGCTAKYAISSGNVDNVCMISLTIRYRNAL